jgi:hypothetical protein
MAKSQQLYSKATPSHKVGVAVYCVTPQQFQSKVIGDLLVGNYNTYGRPGLIVTRGWLLYSNYYTHTDSKQCEPTAVQFYLNYPYCKMQFL